MSRKTPKTLYSYAASCVLLLCAAAAPAADSDAELQEVRERVDEMFDMIDPENVNTSPISGWYTIQKGSIVAYISSDGRYLLQGDLIDLDNQTNLSEVARNDSRRDLMATVADDQTILFSPTEVKYTVSVFTDVDCTYCRRLHTLHPPLGGRSGIRAARQPTGHDLDLLPQRLLLDGSNH